MLSKFFTKLFYIKIYRNKFVVSDVEKNRESTFSATHPFTTSRLLVGEFTEAESLLSSALKQEYKGKWFSPSPIVIIQAMEMAEGGLSSVESSVIRELAFGAGARKVLLWEGKTLSSEEVIEKAKNI